MKLRKGNNVLKIDVDSRDGIVGRDSKVSVFR